MDLIPYAIIHIGVSIGLAANLILVYRKIHKADFLIYWAAFWLCIAFAIASNLVAAPLFGSNARIAAAPNALTMVPFLTFPVLMICAGLSIGGRIRQRTAWRLVISSLLFGAGMGLYRVVFDQEELALAAAQLRPMLTALAVTFFTYRLAFKGRQEAGSKHAALVSVSALYGVHNYFLALAPFGVRVYPNSTYSPSSAAAGILLQFGLTIVFSYAAVLRAGKASADAHEAERRLRALLENVGVAGVIVDRKGRVEFCNSWLANALGLPPETVIGSSWLDRFVLSRDREAVRGVFETGFITGQWPAVHEYSLESAADHELELSWYHTSLRDASGAIIGAASLGIDLSQQKRLESQSQQAQKMETLGRLSGGVAHDFNNHLTAILGFADLLMEDVSGNPKARARVEHIRTSGELAATLTRQLLTFSRQRPVEPKLICLNDTVSKCTGILRRLIRENVALEQDLAPSRDLILADAGQMDHVLMNLALNANDAIAGSGTITIRTRSVTASRPEAPDNGSPRSGEFVLLEVEDTGAGMDEWTRKRVFEPFFTTKAEGRGTGLGLATAYGAVSQAGGWIDVKSQLHKGSLFSVYLPRVEAPQGKSGKTIGRKEDALSVSTILLVEDQDLVREFAILALERKGHRVLSASSAAEALKIAGDLNLKLHALVTDIVMTGMSGDELAHHLREQRPGLAVLFVSGYAFDHDQQFNNSLAPYAFLHKPYTIKELCDHVADLLRKPKASSA